MGRRKKHPGFVNAPGVSRTPSPAASTVSVVGLCLPGLFVTIWAALLPLRQPAKRLRRPMRPADPSRIRCASTESLNLGV